jgi:hypothetical protein
MQSFREGVTSPPEQRRVMRIDERGAGGGSAAGSLSKSDQCHGLGQMAGTRAGAERPTGGALPCAQYG